MNNRPCQPAVTGVAVGVLILLYILAAIWAYRPVWPHFPVAGSRMLLRSCDSPTADLCSIHLGERTSILSRHVHESQNKPRAAMELHAFHQFRV